MKLEGAEAISQLQELANLIKFPTQLTKKEEDRAAVELIS